MLETQVGVTQKMVMVLCQWVSPHLPLHAECSSSQQRGFNFYNCGHSYSSFISTHWQKKGQAGQKDSVLQPESCWENGNGRGAIPGWHFGEKNVHTETVI